VIIMGGW